MYPKPASRYANLEESAYKAWEAKAVAIRSDLEGKGMKTFTIMSSDPPVYGHNNQSVSNCLIEAARESHDYYSTRSNWPKELQGAIAEFEKKYRNVEYLPDDIVLTPGVAGGLVLLHNTFLERGSEVLAVEPSQYVAWPATSLSVFETKVITSPSIEERDWDIDLETLRKRITDRTKFISLENPANPTGATHNEKTLINLVNLAGEYDIPIICDEMYGLVVYDGAKVKSIAELANDVPTIVVSGMSKFFTKPGWRVGYIGFHDPEDKIVEIRQTVKKIAWLYGHATKCIPTPIMVAAVRAYRGSMNTQFEFVRTMQARRDFAFKRLNEIDGVTVVKPRATLYIFPRLDNVKEVWKSDRDLLLDFVKEEGVLFIPGSFFGESGAFHLRGLLLPDIDSMEESFNRLERFLKRHTAVLGYAKPWSL